jgi:hypothetical protein
MSEFKKAEQTEQTNEQVAMAEQELEQVSGGTTKKSNPPVEYLKMEMQNTMISGY